MKKLLVVCGLALGGMLLAHQEASAWINFKRSVTRNFQFQAGGNNFLWGLWQNQQPTNSMYQHLPPATYYPTEGHHHYQTPEPPQDKPAPKKAQSAVYSTGYMYQTGYGSYYPQANYQNNSTGYYPTPYYGGYYSVPYYWYGN